MKFDIDCISPNSISEIYITWLDYCHTVRTGTNKVSKSKIFILDRDSMHKRIKTKVAHNVEFILPTNTASTTFSLNQTTYSNGKRHYVVVKHVGKKKLFFLANVFFDGRNQIFFYCRRAPAKSEDMSDLIAIARKNGLFKYESFYIHFILSKPVKKLLEEHVPRNIVCINSTKESNPGRTAKKVGRKKVGKNRQK